MTQDERWMVRYNEVKTFIVTNKRNPSKYYPEEKLMVHFLKRGRKLMNAILSIKPQFVTEIVAGKKLYEYRKAIFKQPVEKVYIYASAPMSKVVGEFQPGESGGQELLYKPLDTIYPLRSRYLSVA